MKLLFATLLACGLAPVASAQATFHGDHARSGVYPAAGMVYVGDYGGHLHAIDQQTGREKWNFKSSMPIASSPAVADGVVYVGCRDAHVYAIDANTGVKEWDYPTSKSWVNGTPAVRDGMVYVGTADSSRFMALDARTGRLRFNFDARSYVFSSAALAGNSAYVGSHNGKLYAIDANSGKLQWEFQTAASRQNSGNILNPDGSLNLGCIRADLWQLPGHVYRFLSLHADRRDHGLTGR